LKPTFAQNSQSTRNLFTTRLITVVLPLPLLCKYDNAEEGAKWEAAQTTDNIAIPRKASFYLTLHFPSKILTSV